MFSTAYLIKSNPGEKCNFKKKITTYFQFVRLIECIKLKHSS